ncbi:uncharacterized protein LOC141914453 [Tubulanus polymorphus]|uniref:uncharacterized protein LOC141914453 n=1 Tax=Tubulanus polymorphus TaxID=672921 RepID=UPI003DA333D4
MPNRKEILSFVLGASIGAATTFLVYKALKIRSKQNKTDHKQQNSPENTASPRIQVAIPDLALRRSQSREDPPRRFHRLVSSGNSGYIDTSSIIVDDGKNIDTQSMMNLLFCIAENQAKRMGLMHRGITCNICHQTPLCGIRYKCANCSDYDVCDKCEPKDEHNSTHVFLKINTPLPPLASPRIGLSKTLYPGKINNHISLSIDDTLRLIKETNYDQFELEALHQEYRSLTQNSRGISREVFNYCLGPLALESNLLLEQLFKFYDRNNDRFIDFEEMVKGLSILCKGTIQDKLPYAFAAYDIENKKSISRDNMQRMFRAYYDITIELVRDVVTACEEEMMANFDDSSGRPVSSIFSAPIPQDNFNPAIKVTVPDNPGGRENTLPVLEAMSQDAIKEMVDHTFSIAQLKDHDRMSYEKFVEVTTIDNSLVVWFDALGSVF